MKYIPVGLCVLLLVTGCIQQKEDLEFSATLCDESIDPYDQSNLGIKNVAWDGHTLVITGNVAVNCADEILRGYYKITDDTIVLYYEYLECEHCTFCVCIRTLHYTIHNIEKKDYSIEINGVEAVA
ncbi:MAG: hypothetical protein PVF58_02235 [Candidatus Methanofastidiosia archaeon]|jgi:hypothetical protein